MASSNPDPFVRLSTPLLEALFTFHLTGVQLRTILWVLRKTDGWNRKLTPFRWAQIAKKLGTGRAVVWRAGQRLLEANVLLIKDHQLGIQKDDAQWRIRRLAPAGDGAQQETLRGTAVAREQRPALPTDNGSVVSEQRFSVERKKGVKRKDKCRSSGGFVDNSHTPDDRAIRELLNFYGAHRQEALSPEQAGCLYKRFNGSAKLLLDACSGNLQEAKVLLRQSLGLTKPEA
jgi:phage replication O-like protein O